MALRLERERTATTPYVLIDGEKGYMKFEGRSYLENIISFFKDINEWLESYLMSGISELTFDCAMEYCNSATIKLLYNMLRLMDRHAAEGKKITVNWITSGDDISVECGEDFRDEMENLEFNLITGK